MNLNEGHVSFNGAESERPEVPHLHWKWDKWLESYLWIDSMLTVSFLMFNLHPHNANDSGEQDDIKKYTLSTKSMILFQQAQCVDIAF